MPFFCRLESRLLLRARDLDRFLIGRSAIRIWASDGGEEMRLIRSVSPMGTACTTQNTDRSLPEVQRNVKGIFVCLF